VDIERIAAPATPCLETEAHTDDRAVKDFVEAEGVRAAAWRDIVDSQRAKADQCSDLVAGELPRVGINADRLPGNLATQPEAADVTPNENLLVGRELVTHAKAYDRVDPLNGVRTGDGEPGGALEVETREIDIDLSIERGVDRQIPVAKAPNSIE